MQAQMSFWFPKLGGQGQLPPDAEARTRAENAMEEAKALFTLAPLPDCLQAVESAKHQWGRPMLDNSVAVEIMHRLQIDIIGALGRRQFLRVADDRIDMLICYRGEKPHFGAQEVFGTDVIAAFDSAAPDIEEAGNCLAAECNTAAVFHLTRAAEVGLRAVAKDRNVEFANKPIDQQEWGTILGALDGKLKAMREDDKKNWPDPSIKDAQVRFYSEVVQELRGFNEACRRHLSHAREDGIYDRDYADSIFKHVRTFM